MYSKDSYTLQERVEALMLNLAYSCSLFTTPKGRKAYAHSLLVEIQNVILYVNDAIDVIQSNTELFPVAPVFYMNFSALKKEVKDALREQRNNPCLTEQHFKALKELSTRLEEARSRLNGPDLCQMVSCYEKVWNRFYMKWPDMLHEVKVQTLAGMPPPSPTPAAASSTTPPRRPSPSSRTILSPTPSMTTTSSSTTSAPTATSSRKSSPPRSTNTASNSARTPASTTSSVSS